MAHQNQLIYSQTACFKYWSVIDGKAVQTLMEVIEFAYFVLSCVRFCAFATIVSTL